MGIVAAVIVMGLVLAIGAGLANAAGAKKGKQVFAAFSAGGIVAARAAVDRLYPRTKNGAHHERLAALGLLGDVESLERELPLLDGRPLVVYRAQMIGLLGLALAGRDVAACAARMKEIAERNQRESPKLAKLPIRWMHAFANLGAALATRAPSLLERPLLIQATRGQPMLKILCWETMIKVFELAGDAERAANVRQDLGWMNEVRRAQAA